MDQSVRDERNVFRRMKREFVPYKTGKLVARQVSNALDHLLFKSGYDKRIRPLVSYFVNYCSMAIVQQPECQENTPITSKSIIV